jgi:hypothetical protein
MPFPHAPKLREPHKNNGNCPASDGWCETAAKHREDPECLGIVFIPASDGHAYCFAKVAPLFADQFQVLLLIRLATAISAGAMSARSRWGSRKQRGISSLKQGRKTLRNQNGS